MPEAMAQQASNLGMPALGILDRDGLYGALRLYMTSKKLGLRAHIEAEISVAELGAKVLPELWQPHTIPTRPVRLSLLCESQTGYRSLSQLITGYKLQQKTKGEGIASMRAVRERAEGLVCLFYRRSVESGRTSISICLRATIASAPSSTSTPATVSSAQPCVPT